MGGSISGSSRSIRVVTSNEAPIAVGRLLQINVSGGGVPKLPIERARVGRFGIDGDAHNDLTVHGGPRQALCLLGIEAIERLQSEGHPIEPGGAGENLTTVGVEWSLLPIGARVLIGEEVEIELTGDAGPCKTIRGNFSDERFSRMSIDLHPSDSRMYARVLREGEIHAGDTITVLPPAPGSRAVDESLLYRLDKAERKSSVAAWRAAQDAGFDIDFVEDGDLAMSASPEIPGPAFNHASGLAERPNLLSMVTDYFDAHGTTGWLSMDEAPWEGAQPELVLDMFGASPQDVVVLPPPEGVVIRRLEPEEAGLYNSVRSGNTTAGGVTDGGPNPWPQVYTHLGQTRNRHLFIAEIEGEPVANASLHVSGRTGWMRGALVAPEARGRGIQRALISARAQAAAEAGCDLVGASAEAGEISAGNLQQTGLRRVGSRSHYVYEPGSFRPSGAGQS